MSFILDALRKSEHERQRQAGPGLAEVATVPPRPRTTPWATAAVILLIVNLVAIGVLMLRKAQQDDRARDAVASVEPEKAPDVAAAARPGASAAPQAAVTRTLPDAPPPMLRPAEPPPATVGSRNPLELEMPGDTPPMDPQLAAAAAAAPEGPPAVTQTPTRGGTVVYQTLPEGRGVAAPAFPTSAQPTAASGLPTADEIVARGDVPELRLELHVYANRPAERFAFINSRKYREGDTLAEGPQVEEITPDGVVLNQRGSRFLLPRE